MNVHKCLRSNCASWRSTPGDLEERKNRGNADSPPFPATRHKHRQKLRHHEPQQHSLHRVYLSLLPDRMSSDSREELNLRNFHCSQQHCRCSHSWNTSSPSSFSSSSPNFSAPLRFSTCNTMGKPMNSESFFTRSFKRRSPKNSDWILLGVVLHGERDTGRRLPDVLFDVIVLAHDKNLVRNQKDEEKSTPNWPIREMTPQAFMVSKNALVPDLPIVPKLFTSSFFVKPTPESSVVMVELVLSGKKPPTPLHRLWGSRAPPQTDVMRTVISFCTGVASRDVGHSLEGGDTPRTKSSRQQLPRECYPSLGSSRCP